jgi:hypothetical protein
MKQDKESLVKARASATRGALMQHKKEVDWKVLDVGPGRTGTQSIAAALERLGFSPFHAGHPTCRLAFTGPWCSFITGNSSFEETLPVMEGYESASDTPMHAPKIYKAVMQHFPNSKFILPMREPEDWFRSMVHVYNTSNAKQIPLTFSQPNSAAKHQQYLGQKRVLGEEKANIWRDCRESLEWGCDWSKSVEENDACLEGFRSHYRMVQNTIPADRLLKFNITDGYTTLAPFLGKPVPDEAFPHVDTYTERSAEDMESDEFQEGWSTDNCPKNAFSLSWQPESMDPTTATYLGMCRCP